LSSAGDTPGLARQEIKVVTAEDIATDQSPIGGPDEAKLVVAPEVRSVQFEYFDGSGWAESWDSSTPGADGVTPQGPPRAVAIRLGIVSVSTTTGNEDLKYVRHVVAIPSANGTSQQNSSGGTTP
jgi:hypothetical protein